MFRRIASFGPGKNPFYLLSALSMLLGCYALSGRMGLVPGQWKPIAGLIALLQVYEMLLLALAVFLHRRGRAPSDARTVFLLELLFLVDATFLNMELAASDPWIAPLAATAQLILAGVKILALRHALGLQSLRRLVVTLSQIGLLLFLPGVFSAVQFLDSKAYALGLGREMLPLAVYGVWWLTGSIPLGFLWADRGPEDSRDPSATEIGGVAMALPLGSILLHLAFLHWLYDLPLRASYLTPLMLGAATYLAYRLARRIEWLRLALVSVVPLLALTLSLAAPEALVFTWQGPGILPDLVVTPLRLALLGVALVSLLHAWLSGHKAWGWAAVAGFSMAFSGHSPASMATNWTRFIPETWEELGAAAVVAAFAFLALGLATSLGRPANGDPTARRRMPQT